MPKVNKGRFSAISDTTTGGPDLHVSPDPIPNGAASIVISGTGFPANASIACGVAGLQMDDTGRTDANGTFSVTYAGPITKDPDFGSDLMVWAYSYTGQPTGLVSEIFTVEF